jgi:hypothetical protein
MELQHSEVNHRIAELRQLARTLRLERRRPRRRWLRQVRITLGRRLVAMGAALLEGTGARIPAESR